MHKSVLKNEIVNCFQYLSNIESGVFVDGTLGAGGHSIAIAMSQKSKVKSQKFIGIDQDESALKIAQNNIKAAGHIGNFISVHDNFSNIKNVLSGLGIDKINGALLDLGVSSMQLDQKERGFSFTDPNQPLDMRMDQTQSQTAADIVNTYSQLDLTKILTEYGEESFAYKIAGRITAMRKNKKIETVGDLLDILVRAIPVKIQKTSRIHFATKTFQALRIALNDELAIIEGAIEDFMEALSPGGRLAIITFHSLEDRIVKRSFLKMASPCECPKEIPICVCNKKSVGNILTKKPIMASEEEIKDNPRARSAKLRIIEKISS